MNKNKTDEKKIIGFIFFIATYNKIKVKIKIPSKIGREDMY